MYNKSQINIVGSGGEDGRYFNVHLRLNPQ